MNQLKTLLLFGVLSAILVAIGSAFGSTWAWLMLGVALAINLGAYFFSDRLVLAMHRARQISAHDAPRLFATVAELAARAEIPVPRLYLVDDPQPNAFATGRNPKNGAVAVTTGLLATLPEREQRGVLAHEIAHIANRDVLIATIAAGLATAVSHLANLATFAALFGGGGGQSDEDEEGSSPFGGLLFAFVAPIAATLVQLAISRSREYEADRRGALLTGDPEGLARALEHLEHGAHVVPGAAPASAASLYIVNPFAGVGGLVRLFSTHPLTAERVRRLRAMTAASAARPRARARLVDAY
ncbi:MAG: zinc metalloprotease HtpX [Deltaproteobacteria bacterium]|nr:zinc metalloprotease HtpX [Deltaproteobacteria bacterium]